MAAVTKGATISLYGIAGTVTSAYVQSFRESKSFANEAYGLDETGNRVESRRDDKNTEATVELRIRAAYTKPVVGDQFTYGGVIYQITSIESSEAAQAYRIFTLSVISTEYIVLA